MAAGISAGTFTVLTLSKYKHDQNGKLAKIDSQQAIDRLDVRPSEGIIKIQAKSNWEMQIDTTTGEILKQLFVSQR